jgi:hypothetical protein
VNKSARRRATLSPKGRPVATVDRAGEAFSLNAVECAALSGFGEIVFTISRMIHILQVGAQSHRTPLSASVEKIDQIKSGGKGNDRRGNKAQPTTISGRGSDFLESQPRRAPKSRQSKIVGVKYFVPDKDLENRFFEIPSRKTVVDCRQIENNCAPKPDGS